MKAATALLRWMMDKIDRFYHPMLHWALDRPRRTVWGALAVTCAAFCVSSDVLGFQPVSECGHILFPCDRRGRAGGEYRRNRADCEPGFAGAENRTAIKVRAENVGAYNPPVFYNVFQRGENPTHGEVLAIMDEWKGAKIDRDMVERLRAKLDQIPGARIKLVLFQNGAPINAPVEFRVYGPDQDELRKLAAKMEQVLRDTPGTRDVNNPVAFDRVDLDVRVDDAKAALLDVPAGAPRRAIRLALSGERAGTFRDVEGDSYPVVVRLPLADTQPISALESIYVSNRSGQAVQLGRDKQPDARIYTCCRLSLQSGTQCQRDRTDFKRRGIEGQCRCAGPHGQNPAKAWLLDRTRRRG